MIASTDEPRKVIALALHEAFAAHTGPACGHTDVLDCWADIADAVMPAHEAMVLARIKALAEDEPEPEIEEDSCRLVDVDGETVRVRGSGEMEEQDQQALGEVFRAARARMKAAKEAERAEIERQVRAQAAAEIRSIFVLARRDLSPAEAKAEAYETAARHITRGEG